MGRVQLITMFVPWARGDDLVAPLAALTALDEHWLRTHPETPKLYDAGVRYIREGKYGPDVHPTWRGRQKEKWVTIPLIQMIGGADCEDLSAWRASELRVAGERQAVAVAVPSTIGFHIVVRRANGELEDPSRILGMGED